MKHIETYLNVNSYINSIVEHDHALQNVSRTGNIKNEKYFYDRIVLTNESNPTLFSIATGNGWNYTSNSGVTKSELFNINLTDLTKAISGNTALTTFNEFAYFQNIAHIDRNLFSGCTSLREITVPKTVNLIQDGAFDDLPNDVLIKYDGDKQDIEIVDSFPRVIVEYSGLTRDSYLFRRKTQEMGFTNDYITVSGNGFETTILPDELNNVVGDQIDLSHEGNIFVTYYLDKKNIVTSAFSQCGNILKVTIENVDTIGPYAFYYCDGMTDCSLPEKMKSIGDCCFYSCRKLKEIIIPYGITLMGRCLLYGCEELTSVTIPNSVEVISGLCFANCSKLESIVLPKNLTQLGDSCFEFCSSLFEIKSLAVVAPKLYQSTSSYNYVFYNVKRGGILLYPTDGVGYSEWLIAQSFYLGYYNWQGASFIPPQPVPSVVKVVYDVKTTSAPTQILTQNPQVNLFEKAELLDGTVIDMTSGYTFQEAGLQTIKYTFKKGYGGMIPKNIFTSCSTIVSVEIPDNIELFGTDCFAYCYSLSAINIPSTVSFIGNEAFMHCTALTNVMIPDSVTGFGKDAFYFAKNVTISSIGGNVKTIGARAFAYTKLPESFTLPSTIDSLGQGCFKNASGLVNLTIEDGIDYIPDSAFQGNITLSSVTIPNSVTGIGSYAFTQTPYRSSGYCAQYGNIYYPNDVLAWYTVNEEQETYTLKSSTKYINNNCFYGCNSATSIPLPTGVLSIGSSGFCGCTSLRSIILPETLIKIGESCFANSGLYGIIIPSGVKEIPKYCFRSCASLSSVTSNNVEKIDSYAFSGCAILSSFTISNTVKELGASAFTNCQGLKNINIGSGLSSLPDCSFSHCSELTGVTIPSNISLIGVSAFSYCTNLLRAEMTNSVSYAYGACFYGCTNLTSVTLSSGIKELGSHAFQNCTSLKSIDFPNGMCVIGGESFRNCSSLTSVTFGDTFLYIGYSSFRDCISLQEINLPESVSGVEYYSFMDCRSVTSITINHTGYLSFGRYSDDSDQIFENIYLTRDRFINKSTWKPEEHNYGGVVFVDDVTSDGLSICGSTLLSCNKLATSVTVPSSITTISNGCFSGCTKLTSVTLPDSVTAMGKCCLEETPYIISGYCPQSGNIYYPNNVVAYKAVSTGYSTYTLKPTTLCIAYGCFSGCTLLSSLTVSDSVTGIGSCAFDGTPYIINGYCPNSGNVFYPNNLIAYGPVNRYASELIFKDTTIKIAEGAFSGCSVQNVVIPSNLREIGRSAFTNCYQLTSLTISEGVETIKSGAFNQCFRLSSLTIPDSVTTIEKNAFSGMTGLKTLVLGDGLTEYPSDFTNSSALSASVETIKIGNRISNIPNRAFYYYKNLKSVEFGSGVTNFGSYIFYSNPALTSITITSPVEIQNVSSSGTFSDIRSGGTLYYPEPFETYHKGLVTWTSGYLTRYKWSGETIPYEGTIKPVITAVYEVSSTTRATSLILSGPSGLSSVYKMEIDNVEITPVHAYTFSTTGEHTVKFTMKYEYLPKYMFYSFSPRQPIKRIVFGEGIKNIPSYCLQFCELCTAVTLPSTLERIDDSCFYETKITEITLPNSVTRIGKGAFSYCKYLTGITLSQNITSFPSDTFYNCTSLSSFTIPTSVTSIGSSCFAHCSGLTEITIPNSITEIPEGCFYRCVSLSSITLNDNIKTISHYAFSGCTSLAEVRLPNNLETLGAYAFGSCSSLTRIVLPDSLKNLPNKSTGYYSGYYGHNFYGCTSLTSVTIGSGLSALSQSMFEDCVNLPSITIPNTVKNLRESSTFMNCTALTSVVMPEYLEYNIYYSAFTNCKSLTSITIPDGVKEIRGGAFAGCESLTSITIPSGVTFIDSYTFSGCTSMRNVTLNEGLTILGSGCFNGCQSLTSLTIPATISALTFSIFSGNTYLKRIDIGSGVKTLGEKTFSGCTGLTTMILGNGLTDIGASAFANCSSLNSITCSASVSPIVQPDTFFAVSQGGTLYYPSGSNYAKWLGTGSNYLGYYGWTGQEMS